MTAADELEQRVTDGIWRLKDRATQTAVLEALRDAAAVVLPREASWDYAGTRREPAPVTMDQHCFACGLSRDEVRLIRHHIVQIQHGGGNHWRNIVSICCYCHTQIHPWLPTVVEGTDFVTFSATYASDPAKVGA